MFKFSIKFDYFFSPITLSIVKLNREPHDSEIDIKNLS